MKAWRKGEWRPLAKKERKEKKDILVSAAKNNFISEQDGEFASVQMGFRPGRVSARDSAGNLVGIGKS